MRVPRQFCLDIHFTVASSSTTGAGNHSNVTFLGGCSDFRMSSILDPGTSSRLPTTRHRNFGYKQPTTLTPLNQPAPSKITHSIELSSSRRTRYWPSLHFLVPFCSASDNLQKFIFTVSEDVSENFEIPFHNCKHDQMFIIPLHYSLIHD